MNPTTLTQTSPSEDAEDGGNRGDGITSNRSKSLLTPKPMHPPSMTPTQPNNAPAGCMRQLVRLVVLLLTPTWKLRIRQQLHRAEMEYDAAVNAYHEAEGECRSSFYEHNQASYWKGRRDALRMFLPNAEVRDGGLPPFSAPSGSALFGRLKRFLKIVLAMRNAAHKVKP